MHEDLENYLSPIDFLNKKILKNVLKCANEKINAFLIWIFLIFLLAFFAYISKEFETFIGDYSIPALITMIAFMIFSETWIGDNIRSVSFKISKEVPESKEVIQSCLKKIFNKNRYLIGIPFGIFVILAIHYYRDVLWYSSHIVLMYIMFLGFIVGYIFGEALIGSLSVVRSIQTIGNHLISDTSLFDYKKINLIKETVGWGFQISVLLSFILAIAYPAFFFAPFRGQIANIIKLLGGIVLLLTTFLSVFVFLMPTFSIHRIMVSKKNQMLQQLYEKLREGYDLFINYNINEIISPEKQYKFSEFLSVYKILKEDLEKLPTWPFDVETIRKLVGTILVPIASYASQYLSAILSTLA